MVEPSLGANNPRGMRYVTPSVSPLEGGLGSSPAVAEGGVPATFTVRTYTDRGVSTPSPKVETAAGSFEISDLNPAAYSVEIRASGKAPGLLREVKVRPGSSTDVGEILLRPGFRLEGRVVIADGGAAVVLTSARKAAEFRSQAIYLLGMGEGHSHEHISQARDLCTSAAVQSGREAYEMAGLTPADIDLAQIYDCFTPVVLIELEDLGFCEKGDGGAFVESGATALGGQLPMNTNGGLLSYCHPGNPGSMFGLTEAVYQLRGESGPRQIGGAETALVHGQGGIMSSHATLILGQEQVL